MRFVHSSLLRRVLSRQIDSRPKRLRVAVSRPLPVCERPMNSAFGFDAESSGNGETSPDGTPAGLRAADGRGARRPPHPALVHRRPRPAEVLRDHARRAGERLRGGHDVRRLVHRRLLPGAGERRARPARPQQLRAAAVGRSARAPAARMFCDIAQPRRHAVRGRPPPGAEAQPRPGPRAGVHVLRGAGDGVLLLRATAIRSKPPKPLDTRLVLRPHDRRRRRRPPQAHDPDARGDGHPGRVLVPRGRARASTRSTCATPTRCRWPTT